MLGFKKIDVIFSAMFERGFFLKKEKHSSRFLTKRMRDEDSFVTELGGQTLSSIVPVCPPGQCYQGLLDLEA